MSSLLSQCEGCGTTIAIGHPCGTCREKQPMMTESVALSGVALEYSERKRIHSFNAKVTMLLQFATGFVGLMTAICIFFVIFRGSILAFVMIGLFTVASLILGWLTLGANKYFPIDLHCPGCDTRLDDLGQSFDICPCCDAHLK